MTVDGAIKGECHLKVGAAMVIDDLVPAMRSIYGMQYLLNKADAQRKWYMLIESKTTVQIINGKYQLKPAA